MWRLLGKKPSKKKGQPKYCQTCRKYARNKHLICFVRKLSLKNVGAPAPFWSFGLFLTVSSPSPPTFHWGDFHHPVLCSSPHTGLGIGNEWSGRGDCFVLRLSAGWKVRICCWRPWNVIKSQRYILGWMSPCLNAQCVYCKLKLMASVWSEITQQVASVDVLMAAKSSEEVKKHAAWQLQLADSMGPSWAKV